MRHLISLIRLLIILLVCVGKLTAGNPALPSKQLLFDEAGIFRKSPEKKQELEKLLESTSVKCHFHCYLFTKTDLKLDSIVDVSRKLCSECVGERSGCVLLYDESTQHLHLSSPLSVPTFESSLPLGTYVPSEWLEDQFLKINQQIISDNAQLQTEDYVFGMTRQINQILQDRLEPASSRMLWLMALASLMLLLLGSLAWHVVTRKSAKSMAELPVAFVFPKNVMHQRLHAKNGGGSLAVRAWSVWAPRREIAAEGSNYFLSTNEPDTTARKQITGKAMMFRLLSKLLDRSLTKEEILEKYQITEQDLMKWRKIYMQETAEPEILVEVEQLEPEPKIEKSSASKTLPMMPF